MPAPTDEFERSTYDFDLSSVPCARQSLQRFLVEHDVQTARTIEATHVLTELVANAVEHGRPDPAGGFEVSWAVQGEDLVIAVRDSGTPDDGQLIEVKPPSWDSPDGRGLMMVDAFSDHWYAERDDTGTSVTALLRLSA